MVAQPRKEPTATERMAAVTVALQEKIARGASDADIAMYLGLEAGIAIGAGLRVPGESPSTKLYFDVMLASIDDLVYSTRQGQKGLET